ncbi:cytochrome c oxidase accessory protein CcoG [Zwartia hollandica]|uniref:cytochrome c oxidase accessory protein CcoG n=1 Tax=Zwartia hollandica TaxID=324606 RepID=UPI002180A080|nr:cytochrome c oxidase accessory protein CcoG [Zwartia hollandica]
MSIHPKAGSTGADAVEPLAWRPLGATDRVDDADTVEQTLVDIRQKIYARSVLGWFARWRIALVVLTQALFYGLPWVNWNDRQAVLFDLGARKFYIFGMVLWPQDVIYLTLLLIISALGLFLFTAVAGRLFCGYACPQTVYTEIFMWIERRIEGDRIARIRLDESSLSLHKVRVKTIKHLLWLVVAVWTGFSFIGYFAPIRGLMADLMAFALGPWQWFWLLFYSFATWGNAGFLREQVCKYMCPYARFQSVMVDRDTLVVTYDKARGDPRGARSKKVDYKAQGLGDCVDCSICVQVCPTGIDIRDGLQYMCIGCGACVDACNEVMNKLEYPTGLIRYTSERALQEKLTAKDVRRHLLRPRVLIYSVLMLLLVSVFIAALATRTTLRVDVIRDRGMLGREVAGSLIENVYRLQMLNASEDALHLTLSVEGAPGLALKIVDGAVSSTTLEMASASNRIVAVVVRAPAGTMASGPHSITFVTKSTTPDGKLLTEIREKSSFIVPN